MELKLLRSPGMRAIVIAFVMLAGGFFVLVQAQTVAAQAARTELVIGLQNDMTTMNFWNPETNTVWNFYQVEWSFESLFSHDPDFVSFPVLADPAKAGGAGYTVVRSGAQPIIDVYVRPGVTFHDGQPLTRDDVIFTYQTLEWGTPQTAISEALWWPNAIWPHWSGVGKSHVGVEASPADPNAVRFNLYKPYALFFFSTLETTIIPKHIWRNHIDSTPPINITSLKPLPATEADRSIDFSFGLNPSQTQSVIGTGFMKFDSWVPNTGSHISVYNNYWGKAASHTWRSVSYPFFPEHLQSIKFVIFTSLDVISLALQKGEIDTLIWSLTPGFLAQVRFNPAISVEQVTDAGFFYISFNLRRKPWNDVVIRQAISMAIDKDYIVNTLMGGFGIKGYTPISIHNPVYVNSSAQPPSFNLPAAKALLDANGIVDANGDGFREYKDGSPIRATILTPPKDYDPVRADAGIMISNNLKAIGLNIDSAPTSFDTIVAKAFTQVDFDIYILGWLLGDFPETYLKDFFHSDADVAINPAGSNSAGLRDTAVDTKIDQMLVTLDTPARIQIVKDIQGLVVKDLPWNVLYYRKNLNAYRNDAWVGWVNTPPQLYNFWSLSKLRTPGAFTVPPTTGPFSVAITAPERARFGQQVNFDVFVSQNFAPVSSASVWLNASFGGGGLALTGTTDASGHVRFPWTVPLIQGSIVLTATAVKGGSKATESKLMEIVIGPPAPIAQLNLSTTTPVLGVGQTATVVATLVGGLGSPMSGHKVSIDRTLLLGNITPASAGSDVTNAAGKATFTYRAPADASLFPNQHLADFIKASVNVSNKIDTDTQKASLLIFVQNDGAPDWRIVTVQASSDLRLGSDVATDTTATVNVKVTDYAGTALSGKTVEAVLPADGAWNVSVSPASVATDASGLATFTFTATASAAAGHNQTTIPVRFQVKNDPFQASDEVGILLYSLAGTGKYAAKLDISTRAMPALDATSTPTTADVMITVTDKVGVPAANVPVVFQINYGPLGLPAQFPWSFDYGADYGLATYLGEGLDLNSFGAGSLGGSFESNPGQDLGSLAYGVENLVEDYEVVGDWPLVDACDATGNATIQNGVLEAFGVLPLNPWPAGFKGTYYINATSVTNAFGQMTVALTALPHRLDNALQVKAYVGALPGKKLNVTVDACNFVANIRNYDFAIDSGMVISRSPVFAMGDVWWDQPAFTNQDEVATLHARFYTKNGPLADPEVILIRGDGRAGRNVGSLSTLARSGAFFGTISQARFPAQYSNNELTWNVRDQYYVRRVFDRSTWPWTFHNEVNPPLGTSQTIFFSFVPADMRFAYGGRDQMFGYDYGDYWFAPTFAALIAKVPFDFRLGYYFIPGGTFASVSVDKTLVPAAGTATATVTVTDDAGNPIANATVWSGPFQNVTDATGKATFVFGVGSALGALENLVVAATPGGLFARAWYGIMVAQPVLSYGTPTVTAGYAGEGSTISVTVTNTLPVAGNATVLLVVGGQTVAAKTISIGASASQTVTFDYVFMDAGNYQVTVGDKSVTTSVAVRPVPFDWLPIGTLVIGLAVGAVVGWVLLSRRGKKPPAAEAPKEEALQPSEEELGPENL